jgi:glycosyltransferase involved in cell wall biosynthesis
MNKVTVAHLIDDTNPGGVMRLLEFIDTSTILQSQANHKIVPIKRGALVAKSIDAEIIVSHLSVNWRILPFFINLKLRNAKARLIHIEHSYSHAFFKTQVSSPRRFLALLRTTYSLFDTVVSVSNAQSQWFQSESIVPLVRNPVIPPCVSLKPFLALKSLDHISNLSIGAIGRVSAEKGLDTLIRGFQMCDLEHATLNIFGDGPELQNLTELANGDPKIIFHGHTNDPVAAMQGLDVVAMPSKRETYGLVALEAMAAGRMLLVSGVDGLADHVSNGAIKVSENTPEGWCSMLNMVTQQLDPIKIGRARQNTIRAQENFIESWKATVKKHCN